MAKALDLTGLRFGRLVAVRDVGSMRAFRLWQFKCDCGSIIERTTASVVHGGTGSCGCFQREESSRRNSLKIEGQRFGRLVAIHRVGNNRHGHTQWKCQCDCGAECIVAGVTLGKGTKSCGCLQKEIAANTQRAKALPPDEKRRNLLASAARQRARRKSNPLAVMQARVSRLHRHALAKVGAIKTSSTFDQLGYSVSEFVAHIERQFSKGMGWHNMCDWQIDHIIPIASAKTVDDVVALNQLSNLRPMWSKENNAKKHKRLSLL